MGEERCVWSNDGHGNEGRVGRLDRCGPYPGGGGEWGADEKGAEGT